MFAQKRAICAGPLYPKPKIVLLDNEENSI